MPLIGFLARIISGCQRRNVGTQETTYNGITNGRPKMRNLPEASHFCNSAEAMYKRNIVEASPDHAMHNQITTSEIIGLVPSL